MDLINGLSFDEIVLLAASSCDTPIAALRIVEQDGQRVEAKVGLDQTELLADDPLFLAVLERNQTLAISDLAKDETHCARAITKAHPGIRFYAGAPVLSESKTPIGVLCVMDRDPREISPLQMRSLNALAVQTSSLLYLRDKCFALAKSEERFKLAVEGMSFGLLDWDLRTNEAFYSNRWKSALGYPDSEIQPHIDAWRKLIHPEDLSGVLKAIQDHFSSTDERYSIEHRLRAKSGDYKWFLAHGTCIRDRSGLPVRMAIWYQDLTEKKEQERLADEQRERLISSEKMAALGTMAGGIAHEINNPITIIIGNAQQIRTLASKGKLDQAALLKISEKIESTVQRIARIVKGLRNFSKDGDKDPFVTVSVKALIEETLDFCQARFRHSAVALTLSPPPENLMLECRPIPVSQVLLNLLNNAFDAVQSLTEKWVRIEVRSTDDHILISVVDSGGGIPEAIREKLMQPFFTTKEIGKGTGLGLSLSKGLAESHCGSLFLNPDSPNTCFTIQLPRTQRQQQSQQKKNLNEGGAYE